MPWLSRGAQEYMSQACFGYTFNALDLNQRNEYSEAARRYTYVSARFWYSLTLTTHQAGRFASILSPAIPPLHRADVSVVLAE